MLAPEVHRGREVEGGDMRAACLRPMNVYHNLSTSIRRASQREIRDHELRSGRSVLVLARAVRERVEVAMINQNHAAVG